MIFQEEGHINKIIRGEKTQTRRRTGFGGPRYEVEKTYAIQPGRTKLGIPQGRIEILCIRLENHNQTISLEDAMAEGGYTIKDYEVLFERLNPKWLHRFAYTFKFVKKEVE